MAETLSGSERSLESLVPLHGTGQNHACGGRPNRTMEQLAPYGTGTRRTGRQLNRKSPLKSQFSTPSENRTTSRRSGRHGPPMSCHGSTL